MKKSIVCIYMILWVFLPWLGQEDSLLAQTLNDTLQLEEVSIFTRHKLDETSIKSSRVDSLVLSGRMYQSLAEISAENTPVFIKSYGRGSAATASFRGTAPSHTKVSWNGLEINSPMLGMVDFSQIPAYVIDEIVLLHGNSSMMKTPGALGGIIDLSTQTDWKKGLSGSFVQGMGSFQTIDEYLNLAAGNGTFQSDTRLFYNHSENDFSFINRDVIDSVNLETGEKYHPEAVNRNADYSNTGLMQKFSFRKSPDEILEMNLWTQYSERSLPMLTSNESDPDDHLNRQQDYLLRTTLKYKHYGETGILELLSGLNLNQSQYLMKTGVAGNRPVKQIDSESKTHSWQNKVNYSISPTGKDELKLKMRHVYQTVNTFEEVADQGYEQSRHDLDLSISWFHQWGKRFRTAFTLREELVEKDFLPIAYNVGGEYHILPDDQVYFNFSFAKNIRYPSLNDLYFQPGGNPLLEPEVSYSREAGLVMNQMIKKLKLRLSLTGYYSTIENWIIWLPSFKGFWEPNNITEVKSSGIEVNTSVSGQRGALYYKILWNYAWTRSLNYGEPVNWADASLGKQLPYTPEHSSNLNLYLNREGWSMSYTWNYFSERFTTSSNEKHSERDYLYPYIMNHIRFGKDVQISRTKANLGIAIHNLFNEEYRSVLQRPMPGRNYRLMIKIGF